MCTYYKCIKNTSMCVSITHEVNTAFVLTGYLTEYFSHSAIIETTILQRTGKGREDDSFTLSSCSRLTLVLHSISFTSLSLVPCHSPRFLFLPPLHMLMFHLLLFVYSVGSRIMSFKQPRSQITDHIPVLYSRIFL